MKTHTNILHTSAAFLILTAVIFFVSCTGKKSDDATVEKKEAEKVKVISLETTTIDNTLEFTSTLIANEEIYYAPATPGRIDKIFVEVGSRFRTGDLLFVMDQTQLHQARIQLKNLEIDMARFDTLIKTKSIPKQQYDQFKTQYDIAKTNVQFLEENSRLKAPFSGIVSGKYYENGEMFSGAPNTQVGKAAVLTLVQINPLKAMVSVSERYYPLIKQGMEVTILTDVFPDKPVSGKIVRIYPTIDQLSRTFQVEISVPNAREELRPGMFCRTKFFAGQTEALIVPSNAVLKVQGSNERFLFVEENGKARRIFVEIGQRFDDQIEIISDELKAGMKVIVSGQARLIDGVDVVIVK
jgi:membrane fusion protein, multidrug efflux system